MIAFLGMMFMTGVHQRTLRSRIIRRMIEEEYSASDIEKALKAYDGEEE